MSTPSIRTSDPELRAAQWARLNELTYLCLTAQETVFALRKAIAALKAAHAWEFNVGSPDLDFCRMVKKRTTSRVEALQLTTNELSYHQSELMDLQTALDDNYEVNNESV